MGETEPTANEKAIAKQSLDLTRMGIRADIEVLGVAVEKEIPHASTDKVCDVPVTAQTIEHFQCIGINVLPRHTMIGSFSDYWFARSHVPAV
jgi:hypothetical protein